jgi:sulfate transport system ATP-binding protein
MENQDEPRKSVQKFYKRNREVIIISLRLPRRKSMSIEIKNISKTFGTMQALKNVNLVIPDGGLVALLGPSGSGKTTLLSVIAGLEQPDDIPDSEIRFHKQNVVGKDVGERQVGFVFQHYALFRHMNVFENIAFGLRVRPRKFRPSSSKIKEKVTELLKLIQLEGLEQRFPAQLSGGQRQRVALARALAIEPKILLLDEPFGALDARVRQDLRRWLRRLHDEIHVTSVFVTHDQEEALEVADRIVVMNRGKIEQEGTPDEVFHKPASEFVLSFLGNVNLFHGRMEDGKVMLGSLFIDSGNALSAQEKNVKLFVRPYEFDISHINPGSGSLSARIVRIQSAGPNVKIELMTADGTLLNVEISHERSQELILLEGQEVFVTPKQARIFSNDYVI